MAVQVAVVPELILLTLASLQHHLKEMTVGKALQVLPLVTVVVVVAPDRQVTQLQAQGALVFLVLVATAFNGWTALTTQEVALVDDGILEMLELEASVEAAQEVTIITSWEKLVKQIKAQVVAAEAAAKQMAATAAPES